MEKNWTTSDLVKLFRLNTSTKTPIIYAEKKGEIPKSSSGKRGSISIRQWETSQLPKIGEKFGFLRKPDKQLIISVYTPKGGVSKTTLTANLGRALAFNGIRTLVIGLDFQRSLTRYILPPEPVENFDDIGKSNHLLGLHHFLFENAPIDKVVLKTDLPTLDIIPETPDLNFMAKKMRVENRREYIFKEKLIKKLNKYDIVLFDCTPGWNDLTENALVAANNVIMPAACEIECYEALQTNLGEVADFQSTMHLQWDNYLMIPSMLENNTISQNIYAQYLSLYKSSIIPMPTRRSIVAQEARAAHQSIFEYAPTSNLADDYYGIITSIWKKLVNQAGDHNE
ncbi:MULTISPECIES: ParA family protein [Cysteiniphilum]|uniref:Sporulation initiation inhibitor Soj n=1 Tax=Cysteiniphilum litorale TaxID=2056700 RepID=A0A8J3E874_9GAMM|nr:MULTISPECIES: ParA family protein [Cysteiniphilum]GGF92804.1 sporulation initiation inhibitor Soj [Cysteiniphilum litorale]